MQGQDWVNHLSYNTPKCEICDSQMYFDEESGMYYCINEMDSYHENYELNELTK